MWPIEERIFFRKMTIPLARKMKNSRITPNQISIIGFIFSLLSGFLILQNIYIFTLLSCITLYFSYFFDKLDGDLARVKKISSAYGNWFESIIDRAGEIVLTISIIYTTKIYTVPVGLLAGLLALVFPLLFYYYNELSRSIARDKKSVGGFTYGYTRGRHFILLIICALLNRLDIFLYVMSLGILYIFILFLVKFTEVRRTR